MGLHSYHFYGQNVIIRLSQSIITFYNLRPDTLYSLLSVVLVVSFLSTKSREIFSVWCEINGKVACGSGSSLSSCKSYTSSVRLSEVLEVPK